MKQNKEGIRSLLSRVWAQLCYWKNSVSSWLNRLLAFSLSSNSVFLQVVGLIAYQLFFVVIAILLWQLIPIGKIADSLSRFEWMRFIVDIAQNRDVINLSVATLVFFDIIWIVRKLTPLFNIRKQEIRITISQIIVLVAFGFWLLALLIFTGLNKENNFLTVAIAGSVMGWIFQDTVKSVVTFLYVRLNGMIHIGDWIQIESKQIDGVVKGITLTMVTIENWDTTFTSFPTYLLNSSSLKNLQPMLAGKTYGRRLFLKFTIDSGWIQAVSLQDAYKIASKLEADRFFKETQIVGRVKAAEEDNTEVLNIHLFRRYIHHWLMNHKKVSRQPRLVVRYLEPTDNGIPLQIYAFLTEISLEPFEWTQSNIIEHVLESMKLFNLRIYQNASAFDVSNSNIYLSAHEAAYTNYPDERAE